MARTLGDAFVRIRPDATRFPSELREKVSKANAKVDVPAQLDTAKLKPALDKLKEDLKSVTSTRAKITADSADAAAKIKGLKRDLSGLNEKVKVEGDTEVLQAQIAKVRESLGSLGNKKIDLDVNTAVATAQLKRIKAEVLDLDGKDATVDVKVRGQEGVNFMFRGVSNMTTAIVGLAPVAVPALAAVAAGIGTVGAAALAGGGAVGIWGGVLAGALTKYQEDVQTLKTLGKQLATATDPAKAANIKSQMDDIMASWSPAEKRFDKLKESFLSAFQALVKASGPATFGVLNTGMAGLIALMPRLAPLIDATGRAIGGLVSDLVDFTKTQRFQSILDFFLVFGPSAITHFGHIAGNILLGVFSLFTGFAPHGANFLRTFEAMTVSFRTWAAGFGQSNGFQQFMDYARRVLPDVRDLFVNLTEFVGKFFVALGPLGGIELRMLTLFLEGLNSLPPAALTAIAVGITGLVLALKAWELGTKAVAVAEGVSTIRTWLFVGAKNAETGAVNLSRVALLRARVATIASAVAAGVAATASAAWTGAQWLLNAALDANPIGLVVIAVAGLAAGLVFAYKHSETFRKIVDGVWAAVKKAIKGAWENVIKPALIAFGNFLRHDLIPAINRLWSKVVKPAFEGIGTAIRWAWRNVIRPVLAAFKAFLENVLFPVVRFLWNRVIKPAFEGIGTIIRTVWTRVIKPVFGALRDGVGLVRTGFHEAVDGIRSVWGTLRDAVRKPIAFIVNTVFNKGIVPFVNRIPFIPGTLQTIGGFAGGGHTGPGEKYEPAGIVHRDEHVWTKEESSRFPGGHRGLDRLRARTRMGLLREGEMAGYAEGGRVRMDGKLLSVIAARQIRLMEKMAGTNFYVMQGGYGGSHIAASGSSHNYSGVADISPASIQYERLARRVGFAAWARNIAGRSRVGSGAHIHAVSLLDPGDARSPQVYGSWRNHGNGLSGANNDPAPHVPWLPGLSKLLGNIPLVDLRGGGGPGGGGYGGPTVADARESLNPAKWVAALRRMGGWGRGLGGTVSGVVGNLRDVLVNKIKSAVAAAGQAIKSFVGEVIGANSAKSFAQKALGDYGWGGSAQWIALDKLWNKESGWNPRADNPSSSAYGIPQALPGSKMASAGRDWRTNPATQIRWGLGYIKNTYGRPTNAWAHSQRVGWYDNGGVATGRGFLPKYTPLPERVLTARQTDLHDRQTVALEALAAGSGRRMAITITNWKTGEGYMSAIADDRVKAQRAHDGSLGRMRR